MVRVYKPGKVAIVLAGRQAGKKVVVIKQLDEGTKERPYPHAIVAGVERYPLKVTKRMGAKKLAKRSKVKPFIKSINYSHLFPTRYALELEGLKGIVGADTFKEPSQREDTKKQIKKQLEERYTSGKNKWFFTQLRTLICKLDIDEFFHVPNIVNPGQTLSSTKFERRAGGKGANQAVAIAKAGGRVALCGAAGPDGQWMLDDMKKAGVQVEELVPTEGPTGRAIIQLSPDGENSIVLLGGANTEPSTQSTCDTRLSSASYTHLLVQNEIPWASTLHALQTSHTRSPRAWTFFNPSPMPSRDQLRVLPWDAVDWLIVNEGEAEELYTALTDKEYTATRVVLPPNWPSNTTLAGAHLLLHCLRDLDSFPSTVSLVCTLGSLGVVVLPARTDAEAIYVPAAKLAGPVVDTTGAGDCFAGYLVAGFLERGHQDPVGLSAAELEGVVKVAVKAAGMCVTRHGASGSIPSRRELNI
ncbi:hypothetical protein EUX98_g1347 [Antrodiella citrinella]|uniref:Ribokinase n=1 Tax=Antrodiella citrinella TaxID=2447956 RepID=A0A4S4N1S1_9APHY|nr:hypothetical protein EUX98_g1347 [Antrodiella citrinella]